MDIVLEGVKEVMQQSNSEPLVKGFAVVDQARATVAKQMMLNDETSPLTIVAFLDVLRRYGGESNVEFNLLLGSKVAVSGALLTKRVYRLMEDMTAVFINDEKLYDTILAIRSPLIACVSSSLQSGTVFSVSELLSGLWPALRFVFQLVSALHPDKLVDLPYQVRHYLNFALASPLIHAE